mmetsp:Transcript_4355/g.7690  ORF Transcript_4355/g.7690 Transcript_4355/m.7690 type:complete len:245 (-) Transcript_4355:1336-2070(-)
MLHGSKAPSLLNACGDTSEEAVGVAAQGVVVVVMVARVVVVAVAFEQGAVVVVTVARVVVAAVALEGLGKIVAPVSFEQGFGVAALCSALGIAVVSMLGGLAAAVGFVADVIVSSVVVSSVEDDDVVAAAVAQGLGEVVVLRVVGRAVVLVLEETIAFSDRSMICSSALLSESSGTSATSGDRFCGACFILPQGAFTVLGDRSAKCSSSRLSSVSGASTTFGDCSVTSSDACFFELAARNPSAS